MLRLLSDHNRSSNTDTPFEHALRACGLDVAVDRHGLTWDTCCSMSGDKSGARLYRCGITVNAVLGLRVPTERLQLTPENVAGTGFTVEEWAKAHGTRVHPHVLCGCAVQTLCAATGWPRVNYDALFGESRLRPRSRILVV